MSRTPHRLSRRATTSLLVAAALTVATGSAVALPTDALPGDPTLSSYHAPVSDKDVTVTPIDFTVSDLLEPGSKYVLRGFLYEPKGKEGCRTSILQANHALTTGAWYWDIPYEQQRYSIARKIARSGIPFLALNKLGYGQPGHPYRASDRPNGLHVTVQVLADVSHQVTQQLRAKGYQHVGLIGHSAGSEESEEQAGLYQDVDAMILSGFTHLATPRFTKELLADNAATQTGRDDYPFFFGTQNNRDSFLFTKNIDPKLVKALHPLVNETPIGEIDSIGPQPSRATVANIKVPVLTLVGEDDQIFDAAGETADRLAFTGTRDVSFYDYPGVGHGVEFHRNGPQVTTDVVNWLTAHSAAMPHC
jgi:pimeloyl-ACP methyl ester carboxylesterase